MMFPKARQFAAPTHTLFVQAITMFFFDFHHCVTEDEIDAQRHVHNLRYLQWTLWAARDHNAKQGWDAAAALQQGQGWVVRDHDITYRVAAVADDKVIVRTWVSEIRRYACTRRSLICRPADQKVLARVATRWVFADLLEHKALTVPKQAAAGIEISAKPPNLPWEKVSAESA